MLISLKTKCSHQVLSSCFLQIPEFITIIQEALSNFIYPDVGLTLKSFLSETKEQEILNINIIILNTISTMTNNSFHDSNWMRRAIPHKPLWFPMALLVTLFYI